MKECSYISNDKKFTTKIPHLLLHSQNYPQKIFLFFVAFLFRFYDKQNVDSADYSHKISQETYQTQYAHLL